MTILKDRINPHTYVEFTVIDHRLDEMEGSQLAFTYVQQDQLIYEVKFGWSNRVVHSFIEMLKRFPIEQYEGYFSHFEKHLELKWNDLGEADEYEIHFIDADIPILIRTNKTDLIELGTLFEEEWKQSPVIT